MIKWYSWIPRVLQTIAWVPTRLLLAVFCHFQVSGAENLRGLRQAIFAVNHSSELDPIVLTAALSPLGRFSPMFYLAAPRDVFADKSFGWRRYIYTTNFFKAWGAYPAATGLKDYSKTLADHLKILRDGGSLCVFPEGKRTRDGHLQEAHGGVSYLAHASKVPVVPVAIVGMYNMSMLKFFDEQYHIVVVFGKPRYVHEQLTQPVPELHLFKAIANELLRDVEVFIASARAHIDGRIKNRSTEALQGNDSSWTSESKDPMIRSGL